MPLTHSPSKDAFGSNLKAELGAGKPKNQALAIAYSIQRRAERSDAEIAKAAQGVYQMGEKEAMAEHLRLIQVLASPGHQDDKAELARQAEELPEIAAVAKAIPDPGAQAPHPEPTIPQLKAGNYKKGHWRLHGLDISIENLAGSTRKGVDPDGNAWAVTLPYHYGYIRRAEGADGDQLDVAIGPLFEHSEAHIINQRNPKTGDFDEHKVFIGFPSREAAIAAFRRGRSDDPEEVMGSVITVPVEELKRWIANGCLEEEAILKAEGTVHVKAHYRVVNGKVTYIPNYDKTVHGEHPEASLHQRTVYGVHKEGTHTLRATDSEDREAIKAAAAKVGIQVHHVKRAGATHHGRTGGAYDVVHFNTEADAKKVHDLLATEGELHDAIGKEAGPDKGPEPTENEYSKASKQATEASGIAVQASGEAHDEASHVKAAKAHEKAAGKHLEAHKMSPTYTIQDKHNAQIAFHKGKIQEHLDKADETASKKPGSEWWMKNIAPFDHAIEGIEEAMKKDVGEFGYIRMFNDPFKVTMDLWGKKIKTLKDAGQGGAASDAEAVLDVMKEAQKKAQKRSDYIEADLPIIVSEAAKTSDPNLYKLAAVISLNRAKAEEDKDNPDQEKAKLWWTNASSFATLAQQ